MTKLIRFLCSRRLFSTTIPPTPTPTPTHFDFSGEKSNTERALVSALSSCASKNDVTWGKQIHSRVLKTGLNSNGFIVNSILNMYSKCSLISDAESVFKSHTKLDSASFNIMVDGYVRSRRLNDALKLFDVMPDSERSCVSYTTLIKGYSQNGNWIEAMELFKEMRSLGILLNEVTLATVVSACSHLGWVCDCRMLHSLAIKVNLDYRVFVSTNLLHMYCICSCLEDARKLFDEMSERNLVTWNVMLNGYSKAGRIEKAKELFDEITDKDIVSWGTIIDGCLRKNQLDEALVYYTEMLRYGMKPSAVMMVDLLSASARSSSSNGFNGLQLHGTTVKSGFDCYDFLQATIIYFYAVTNNMKLALQQFEASVKDHIASRNALIAGFVKNGMVDEAREVFDRTSDKDIFSWNAMISGYAQSVTPRSALHLFHEMINSKVKPDAITMVSVFSAISSIGSLEEGRRAHDYLNRSSIPQNDNLTAAIIDMYAKCGSIDTALTVFHQIESSTISPWNAIICGSATNGRAKLALELYTDLQSLPIKPNSITFVGVLNACCQAGLVELGQTYFNSMKSVYGVEPDIKHYGCMVDILGKAGRLEEAKEMIKKLPVKADVIIWGILLSASRIHRNVEVAEFAAAELSKIDPSHEGCKVLLSNVYADAGRWEDVALVREEMRAREDVEWSTAFSGVV